MTVVCDADIEDAGLYKKALEQELEVREKLDFVPFTLRLVHTGGVYTNVTTMSVTHKSSTCRSNEFRETQKY